jgi:HK97 family phage portal protein
MTRASPSTLKQKIAWPMLVHGNSVLWKVRDRPGSPPTALLPLDWRYLVPRLEYNGDLLFWETTQFQETVRIAPEDVLHFAWDAGHGEMGLSPLMALGVTFQTEDAIQRSQAASFGNGIRASGAFVIPDTARTTKEQRDELRDHLATIQAGVDNAGRPLLLFNGAKWESTQQTAVEVELIEQRKLNREEIAAAYDMPPPMVGILDKATHSNITEQHKILYTDVLGPWLTLIEETIEAQLIRPEPSWADLKVEFDLAEVLRGDLLAEMQAIKEGIGTGILTPNEGRAIRNLAPSPAQGANELYLPTNNLSVIGTPDAPADAVTSPTKAIVAARRARCARAHRDKGMDPGAIPRFLRELAEDTGRRDRR